MKRWTPLCSATPYLQEPVLWKAAWKFGSIAYQMRNFLSSWETINLSTLRSKFDWKFGSQLPIAHHDSVFMAQCTSHVFYQRRSIWADRTNTFYASIFHWNVVCPYEKELIFHEFESSVGTRLAAEGLVGSALTALSLHGERVSLTSRWEGFSHFTVGGAG